MTSAPLKVALGQLRLILSHKRANVAALFAKVAEAAAQRCQLLVLPECCFAGWLSPAAHTVAEPVPGNFTRKLAALAKQYRMAIVAGFEERDGSRYYNSAIFLDEHGELLLHHRKIHELDVASPLYSTGSSLQVVEWAGHTIGLSICADSWRPEVTDTLWLMGARLILSPCAWAVEPGGESTNLAWITETYRQRIADRDLTIVAPNAVGPLTDGPWSGRLLQGNSLVIGPRGKILAQGPTHDPALVIWQCP
jgi:predicted amidohydrolase